MRLLTVMMSLTPNKQYDPKFYYKDPRIHSLGNHGLKGKLHAEMAPVFTKAINAFAYEGMDVRKELHSRLDKNLSKLDLCCGVGFSTPDYNSIGVDSSSPMINKARELFPYKNFELGNAENYKPDEDVDITSICFAFHEMPQFARLKILDRVSKYTKKYIYVLDISPQYQPSALMLQGEPYIMDYKLNIEDDLDDAELEIIKEGHVNLWRIDL